jgi:hypothetical protein
MLRQPNKKRMIRRYSFNPNRLPDTAAAALASKPMATFRALINIPKAQLKGTDNPRKQREARLEAMALPEPQWTTEHAVRVALLDGSLVAANKTFDQAWKDMEAWQRYQKELDRQTGFRKQQARPNHKRYTHVMAFGSL